MIKRNKKKVMIDLNQSNLQKVIINQKYIIMNVIRYYKVKS